jgi:hypothetical protein
MSWDIEVVNNSLGGIQRLYKFSNGLYLSAVKNSISYGNREHMGEKDQWEIAVVDSEGNWKTKDIFPDATDDVIGWLDFNRVYELVHVVDDWR